VKNFPGRAPAAIAHDARRQRSAHFHRNCAPAGSILKAADLHVEWHEFPKAHAIHGEEELAVIRNFVRAGYPA